MSKIPVEHVDETAIALDASTARALTDRIKVGVEAVWELITQAYVQRAWDALGYSSWDDYCTREFGTSRLRLRREERAEVVASLRDQGSASALYRRRQVLDAELSSAILLHLSQMGHVSRGSETPSHTSSAANSSNPAKRYLSLPARPSMPIPEKFSTNSRYRIGPSVRMASLTRRQRSCENAANGRRLDVQD